MKTLAIRFTSLFVLFQAFFTGIGYGQGNTENGQTTKNWYELNMMSDPILDQTLLFYLAMTYSQQADIGECLETASRVKTNDPASWAREWTKTGHRLDSLARFAESKKHFISAGKLYLRSATYFSAALHRHNNPADPLVKENTQAASQAFRKALKLLQVQANAVEIPYEKTSIPGYFFKTTKTKGPAPTLIVHQGRDGWAIHCKYIADAANERGYNCLLIDGPGQGEMLRLQGTPFRPDWEKVISPVVDYLVKRKDVDPARIGLMGLSMGGSLAPRAAAFEHRLKVCVANPGVLDWPRIVNGFLSNIDPAFVSLWKTDSVAFNRKVAGIMATVPLVDWGMKDMLWKHGVDTPAEFMNEIQQYSIKELVSKIKCKMLVMDGTVDEFSQARDLCKALQIPNDYMLFGAEDAGLQHCQVGLQSYSSARLFDWLDENL